MRAVELVFAVGWAAFALYWLVAAAEVDGIHEHQERAQRFAHATLSSAQARRT